MIRLTAVCSAGRHRAHGSRHTYRWLQAHQLRWEWCRRCGWAYEVASNRTREQQKMAVA